MVTIEQISRKVAKDLNMKESIVDRIHRIQYKFLYDTIQSGSLENIQLIYIGKFIKGKKYEFRKAGTNIPGMEQPNIQE